MSGEWELTFCLRAQSELLEASLDKIPENGSKQRKAITRRLSQMFCDFVNQLSPPLVLEIGAHEGNFSKDIKKARPECRVIAFEAHPLVYAHYAPALKEVGVEYVQCCVADREGAVLLKAPIIEGHERPKMGSLLYPMAAEVTEYQVNAITLDGFLGDAADTKNAMWLDVEGAVAHVFTGAKRTLRNCQALYLEAESVPRWKGQMIDAEVISHLADYGLKPVVRDIQRESGQYNVILMRQALAPLNVASRLRRTGRLKSFASGDETMSSSSDQNALTLTIPRANKLLGWLSTGQFSRALEAAYHYLRRRVPLPRKLQNKFKNQRPSRPRPQQPLPTIDVVDVQHLGSLSVNDVNGVAVVMPCIDLKMGKRTAQLLARRAGMTCRILVVKDSLRQGFIRTLNDTAARLKVRYVVYLAADAYPGRDWLRNAHDVMEKSRKALLGFNDGTYKGRIAAFGMVRTDWAQGLYGGPIFYPGYKSHAADTELTVIARATELYVYDANCTLVEYDPKKESKRSHKPDAKLFRQRFITCFDGLVPVDPLVSLAQEYKIQNASIGGLDGI